VKLTVTYGALSNTSIAKAAFIALLAFLIASFVSLNYAAQVSKNLLKKPFLHLKKSKK